MAINKIEYTISASGILPATEQLAGTQGDHCATKINISINDELYTSIIDNSKNCSVLYRFDVYDGEGGIWQSNTSELNKNISFNLEERHTRFGGIIIVYLIITALSQDGKTELELYSFPMILKLENRPEGIYQQGENYESVTGLVWESRKAAQDAQRAAQDAQQSSAEAQEIAAEIDNKLNQELIDKKYNPLSEKAQSGKAVAEALQDYVEKVKGNTMTDQIYGIDFMGKSKTLEVDDLVMFKSGVSYQNIPRRKSNGNIMTNTPIEDLDCANKKYVDDVVVNAGSGGSVDLSNHVKFNDIANGDRAGVVKLSGKEGIWLNGDILTINQATNSNIDSRTNKRPITSSNLDYAVKVGLTTNTETLTDEEKATAQSWLGIGNKWELINKITTTEDVKQIRCTTDTNGNEFLLKKVVFIVRSQPSASTDGNGTLYYCVGTYKNRSSNSTVFQIGELQAGLRTTAQQNTAYVERECYIPSGRQEGNGLAMFDIVGGDSGSLKPKYQMRDIIPTRDEQNITLVYVESGSDTTVFGAGSELEIWGVRA